MKRCYIFCHGWGTSQKFWENLSPYFKDEKTIYLDAGYFGDPQLGGYEDPTWEYVGIGHSLGLIKLLDLNISFKALVSLQGFTNFLGNQPILREKRELEWRKFKVHFVNNSVMLLNYFYQQAGIETNKNEVDKYNYERLYFDLIEIMPRQFNLPSHVPVILFAAKDDPIVPLDLMMDNFSLQPNIKWVTYENGKHALGFREAHLTYKHIMRFLDDLG